MGANRVELTNKGVRNDVSRQTPSRLVEGVSVCSCERGLKQHPDSLTCTMSKSVMLRAVTAAAADGWQSASSATSSATAVVCVVLTWRKLSKRGRVDGDKEKDQIVTQSNL